MAGVGSDQSRGSNRNPRYANGTLRRKHRARFKSMRAPCGICGGRLGEIDYDAPSRAEYPLSFVIDEIRPVSLWRQFGYDSPEQAAQDWTNLQAAHYVCNQRKSNHVFATAQDAEKKIRIDLSDGDW